MFSEFKLDQRMRSHKDLRQIYQFKKIMLKRSWATKDQDQLVER